MMNRCLNAAGAAVVLALAAGGARADGLPDSVISMFKRVPELPATVQEATRWADPQGRLVHPGLLALKADIQAHQQAVDHISAVAGERGQVQGAVVVENLGKGLADAGIDMARMKRIRPPTLFASSP